MADDTARRPGPEDRLRREVLNAVIVGRDLYDIRCGPDCDGRRHQTTPGRLDEGESTSPRLCSGVSYRLVWLHAEGLIAADGTGWRATSRQKAGA